MKNKNIFLIPTDKPSKLYKSIDDKLSFTDIEFEQTNNFTTNHHIYITSDEDVMISEWCIKISMLYKGGGIAQKYSFIDSQFKDIIFIKKIILTTDEQLIKDGVQAIDNEFLEWFVKNPICNHIPTITTIVQDEVTYKTNVGFESWKKEDYKMIECYFTPRKDTSSATICENCGKEKFLHTIGQGIKVSAYIVNPQEESKQETIEEAAYYKNQMPKYSRKDEEDHDSYLVRIGRSDGFIEGVKWQQKQDKNKYSEDDMKLSFEAGLRKAHSHKKHSECWNEWFNQFKKKTKLEEEAKNNWNKINSHYKDGLNPYAHRIGFIEGANSNYVKRQMFQSQIDVLQKNRNSETMYWIDAEIDKLQQDLNQLENEK